MLAFQADGGLYYRDSNGYLHVHHGNGATNTNKRRGKREAKEQWYFHVENATHKLTMVAEEKRPC